MVRAGPVAATVAIIPARTTPALLTVRMVRVPVWVVRMVRVRAWVVRVPVARVRVVPAAPAAPVALDAPVVTAVTKLILP